MNKKSSIAYLHFRASALPALGLGLCSLLSAAQPAYAGHWKVNRYLLNRIKHDESILVAGQYDPGSPNPIVATTKVQMDIRSWYRSRENKKNHLQVIDRADGRYKYEEPDWNNADMGDNFYDGFSGSTDPYIVIEPYYNVGNWKFWGYKTNGLQRPIPSPGQLPGSANGTSTYVAELKWEPDPWNPTEEPPADVYLLEDAKMHATKSVPNGGTSPFVFKNLKHPFVPGLDTYMPTTGYEPILVGKRLIHRENPNHDTIVYGPARTFSGEIKVDSYDGTNFFTYAGNAVLHFRYHVTPLQFELKWKDGDVPVAAGAKNTPVHKAEFMLSFQANGGDGTDGDSAPDLLSNIPLDLPLTLPKVAVEVVGGGLGLNDTVAAQVALTSTTTDSQGRVQGTFTSGNRVQTTTIGVPKKLGNGNKGTFHSIGAEQKWVNVEWRISSTGSEEWPVPPTSVPTSLKPWPSQILRTNEDQTKWAYTRLTFTPATTGTTPPPEKPIADHRVVLLIQKLVVKIIDPVTHQVKTKFFTRDEELADQLRAEHANDTNFEVICKDDMVEDAVDYITLPEGGTTDGNGVYKGAFTTKYNNFFVINEFVPYLRDLDVLTK